MKTKPKKRPKDKPTRAKTRKPMGIMAVTRYQAGPVISDSTDEQTVIARMEDLRASLHRDREAFIAWIEGEIAGAEAWLDAKQYTGNRRSRLHANLPPSAENRRPAETLAFIDAASALLPRLRRHLDAGDTGVFDALRDAYEAGRASGACFAYEAVSPSPGRGRWSDALDQFNDHLAARTARGEHLPDHEQLPAAFLKFQRERGGETFETTDKAAYNGFKKALHDARERIRNTALKATKKTQLPKA